MAKICYNIECNQIYIIGGAQDPKAKVTIARAIRLLLEKNETESLASMN